MKLTPYALAQACGVPRTRIERLAREETPVTADTALRLARYFGTTAEFWMGMQAQYDLERAQDAAAAALRKIKPREECGLRPWPSQEKHERNTEMKCATPRPPRLPRKQAQNARRRGLRPRPQPARSPKGTRQPQQKNNAKPPTRGERNHGFIYSNG